MSGFGLTLSDQLDMQVLDMSPQSKGKMFNYFNYPINKIKQKPFSTIDYSLDDSMNIILDQPIIKQNKYDKIIQGQQKLINLLRQENASLKQRNIELEAAAVGYAPSFNFVQEIMPICYLLNLDCSNQYVCAEIYQSVQNVLNQLINSQNKIKDLQKKAKQIKDSETQRVNSSTYVQKPQGRDTRNKRGAVQYRQKYDAQYIDKLQKQLKQLRQQCNKLKTTPPPQQQPLFISNVKEKKVQVIIQKIIEKEVEKIVEVEKKIIVEKIVQKPIIVQKIVEKPIYFQKKIKEEVPIYIDRFVEKPTPIYIDREIEVEKLIFVKESSNKQSVSNATQTQN